MKYKTFNQISIPTFRKTGFWIRINPKNGYINFSQELSDHLGLKKNKVNFIQNEDDPKEWFLEPTSDKDAFPVHIIQGKINVVRSTGMARTILKALELEHTSYRFIVSSAPFERNLFPIITKSAKHPNKKAA